MGNTKLLMSRAALLAGLFLCVVSLGCTSSIAHTEVAPAGTEEVASAQTIPPPMVAPVKATVREVDPMSGLTFTFSAVEARVRTLIYAMAVDMGLNVVFSADVDPNIRVSTNFLRTPMKDALDLIMDIADMNYEIRGNIFYISKYSSINYSIPYLPINATPTTSLGGDVVGGADQDGNTNLSGEYTLKFERSNDNTDFYTELDSNLKSILASDSKSTHTINRVSSVVSVNTSRLLHKRIRGLMDNIVSSVVRQVQIEAKILEVSLSDSWSYGIDWSTVFNGGQVGLVQSLAGSVNGSVGTMNVVRGSFSGMVNAVATYGKVDTLANPRITVMNNQSAMITAGKIKPYWNKTLSTSESTGGSQTREYTFEKYSVLDGVMIGVTVFIHDDGSVMLNVLPITTKVDSEKDISESGIIQATAPIIDVKESGTIVQVEDGAMLVIGGLITNNKTVENKRIPLLGDIPLLGYLFSSETVSYEKRELVIFIKPTVIYGKSKVVAK